MAEGQTVAYILFIWTLVDIYLICMTLSLTTHGNFTQIFADSWNIFHNFISNKHMLENHENYLIQVSGEKKNYTHVEITWFSFRGKFTCIYKINLYLLSFLYNIQDFKSWLKPKYISIFVECILIHVKIIISHSSEFYVRF